MQIKKGDKVRMLGHRWDITLPKGSITEVLEIDFNRGFKVKGTSTDPLAFEDVWVERYNLELVEEKNLEYLEARGLNKDFTVEPLEGGDFEVKTNFVRVEGTPEVEGYTMTTNSGYVEFVGSGKKVYRGSDGEWHELPEKPLDHKDKPTHKKELHIDIIVTFPDGYKLRRSCSTHEIDNLFYELKKFGHDLRGHFDLLDPDETPSSQDLIIKECDELKELLLTKNRRYGDSALKSGIAFNLPATTAIKARINDKLARLKNDNQDEDEDIVKDLLGYFILLRIAIKQEKENKDEELRLEHGII